MSRWLWGCVQAQPLEMKIAVGQVVRGGIHTFRSGERYARHTKFDASWKILNNRRVSDLLVLCIHDLGASTRTQGQDAVYNSTGGIVGSPSFIDASMFLRGTQGRDLCDTIYGILSSSFGSTYPAAGAVIDARGISGATNLTCTHGTPWSEGSSSVSLPSTILLPATGGSTPTPIIIATPWVIPSNTHLIGETLKTLPQPPWHTCPVPPFCVALNSPLPLPKINREAGNSASGGPVKL
jgi:hypothetical protein